MARNTINYTITDESRDKGKVFILTEMSAFKAESWALRVLLALTASNVQVPEGFEKLGIAAIAEMGLRALSGLKYEVAAPLLAEMMQCAKIMLDPAKPNLARALLEDDPDIEEVATRIKLRIEIWNLHTGFLKAVAPSLFRKNPAPASSETLQNT